jgi:hypothetical protein
MYVDPCGNCLHQWNFWDDCEDCGGKTFVNKMEDGYNAVSSFLDAIGLVETVNAFANNSTLNKIFHKSYGVTIFMSMWNNTVYVANDFNATINDPYWTTEEKLKVIVWGSLGNTIINGAETVGKLFVSDVATATGVLAAGTISGSGNVVGGVVCGTITTFALMDIGNMAVSGVANIARTSFNEWKKGWFRG